MEENNIQQKESVKLIKNTRGYSWEIKLLGNDIISDFEIKRLEQLDKELKEKFGDKINSNKSGEEIKE